MAEEEGAMSAPYWDGEHVLRQLEALRRAKRQAEEDPCCDADDVASLTRTMNILLDEYTNHYHAHAELRELDAQIGKLSATIHARTKRLAAWQRELDFDMPVLSSNLGSDFVARQLSLVAECNVLKRRRQALVQELREGRDAGENGIAKNDNERVINDDDRASDDDYDRVSDDDDDDDYRASDKGDDYRASDKGDDYRASDDDEHVSKRASSNASSSNRKSKRNHDQYLNHSRSNRGKRNKHNTRDSERCKHDTRTPDVPEARKCGWHYGKDVEADDDASKSDASKSEARKSEARKGDVDRAVDARKGDVDTAVDARKADARKADFEADVEADTFTTPSTDCKSVCAAGDSACSLKGDARRPLPAHATSTVPAHAPVPVQFPRTVPAATPVHTSAHAPAPAEALPRMPPTTRFASRDMKDPTAHNPPSSPTKAFQFCESGWPALDLDSLVSPTLFGRATAACKPAPTLNPALHPAPNPNPAPARIQSLSPARSPVETSAPAPAPAPNQTRELNLTPARTRDSNQAPDLNRNASLGVASLATRALGEVSVSDQVPSQNTRQQTSQERHRRPAACSSLGGTLPAIEERYQYSPTCTRRRAAHRKDRKDDRHDEEDEDDVEEEEVEEQDEEENEQEEEEEDEDEEKKNKRENARNWRSDDASADHSLQDDDDNDEPPSMHFDALLASKQKYIREEFAGLAGRAASGRQ